MGLPHYIGAPWKHRRPPSHPVLRCARWHHLGPSLVHFLQPATLSLPQHRRTSRDTSRGGKGETGKPWASSGFRGVTMPGACPSAQLAPDPFPAPGAKTPSKCPTSPVQPRLPSPPQPFPASFALHALLCSPRLYYSDKTLETIKIHNRGLVKWDTATQAGTLCCH